MCVVQAVISISEHANRVLNVVKAKYSLKDKSQAIEVMATEYEQEVLEPELRPEFIQEILRIRKKGKFRRVKTVKELFE